MYIGDGTLTACEITDPINWELSDFISSFPENSTFIVHDEIAVKWGWDDIDSAINLVV